MDGPVEENKSAGSPLLALRPVFMPPPEMRRDYLKRRRSELDALLSSGRGNEWKYVVTFVQHVRGTGGMYGFVNIGDTAASLYRAIHAGDPNCMQHLESYARAVEEAYV